jgi:hypothetical protein
MIFQQELRDFLGGMEYLQLSQLRSRLSIHLLPCKPIQVDYNVPTSTSTSASQQSGAGLR